MVERWEAGQEDRGIEPVDPMLDELMGHMAIAEAVGGWVSALDVPQLPMRVVAAAMVKIEAASLGAEARRRTR